MLSLKLQIYLVGIQEISNFLFHSYFYFVIFNIAKLNALANSSITYHNVLGIRMLYMLND